MNLLNCHVSYCFNQQQERRKRWNWLATCWKMQKTVLKLKLHRMNLIMTREHEPPPLKRTWIENFDDLCDPDDAAHTGRPRFFSAANAVEIDRMLKTAHLLTA